MPMTMKEWAKRIGVTYPTVIRWNNLGQMPDRVTVLTSPTGRHTIIDPALENTVEDTTDIRYVGYCRVSSSDQKDDLERQAGRVLMEASARGIALSEVVTEIGSGLNANRPKFKKLLADPTVTTIVVEHKERAARFGVEHLESALSAQGRSILILDDAEVKDDLVRDMTEILTSFCARLYGKRAATNRAKKALEAAKGHTE